VAALSSVGRITKKSSGEILLFCLGIF